VTAASVIPLQDDVISILRPPAPSGAFAIVRGAHREHTVTIYDGAPPKQVGEHTFKVDAFAGPNYAVSADGQRLLRIATFPKLSVRALSAADGSEVGAVELDAALGEPTILGFLGAGGDRFVIRWEGKFGKYGLEVWDLKNPKRFARRVDLPDHEPAAANVAISPDGRLFATAVRAKPGGSRNPRGGQSQLALYSMTDVSARRLPIQALDPQWSIEPAGIAFSPDGSKVAALFAKDGNALVVAWNAKTGKVVFDKPLPFVVEPLAQLSGAAVGRAAFGAAPSIDWMPGGNAWLVAGASVVDATTGQVLGDLAGKDVFAQAVVGDRFVHLAFRQNLRPGGLAVLTLDAKTFPPAKPPASPTRTAPPTAAAKPAPKR
jgi:hypothetical protein